MGIARVTAGLPECGQGPHAVHPGPRMPGLLLRRRMRTVLDSLILPPGCTLLPGFTCVAGHFGDFSPTSWAAPVRRFQYRLLQAEDSAQPVKSTAHGNTAVTERTSLRDGWRESAMNDA